MTTLEPRQTAQFIDPQIEMAHGAGGIASRRLLEYLIVPAFANDVIAHLGDAATLNIGGARLATTTDAYVVRPLRFPGGSIGELAVNGTLNDLAVSGARPCALMASLILEAGLPGDVLRCEIEAMAAAAARAGVGIVGGDTKVVEHGLCDGMYVATFGIGSIDARCSLDARSVRAGDVVLLTGPIGDHGITILLARGDLDLEANLESDTRSVWPFVEALLDECGPAIRWMRDPTRGGVATSLNELAREARVAVVLEEERIPVHDAVRGACEILGLDPLHIANEGQALVVVDPCNADAALSAIKSVSGGEDAAIIGEVRAEPARAVLGMTPYGASRAIDMLVGDPLPRIC